MNNVCNSLLAWMELTEAKARYCRFLDTKDWQAFGELMTEDFELDLSGTSSQGVFNGRDAALQTIRASIETAKTAHQVHNPEITLNEQGNEAEVIWAMQDRVVWPENGQSLTGYGHYHERWRKENGAWKLAAQCLTRLHMELTHQQEVV